MADSTAELVQPVEVLSAGVEPDAASDPDALTLAAFDRHATSLLRYVRTFGLGKEESEDVVQEAFLALFQHLTLGRDQSNLTGWLFRVAHNIALKRHRTVHRRPAHYAWDESLAQAQVDPGLTPEGRMIRRERHRQLWDVVAALPTRDRQCLLLRANGLTYREISRTVGASLGAVAKSLTRVMTRLVAAEEGEADV